MNASERPDALPEMDHAREQSGKPRVDTVPHEHHSNSQTTPRNPEGPHIPDGGAVESFVGGAGI
jgi:hypothetical protein